MGSIVTRTKPKYPVIETLNMIINIARKAMGRVYEVMGQHVTKMLPDLLSCICVIMSDALSILSCF